MKPNLLANFVNVTHVAKCDKPVYPSQNAIECSHNDCMKWFHLRYTHFSLAEYLDRKSRLHTQDWFCPDCTMAPFHDLNIENLSQLVNDDSHLRSFFNIITCNADYTLKFVQSATGGLPKTKFPNHYPA